MKNLPKAVDAQISKPVKIWVNYMAIVLLVGSLVFMFSHMTAFIIFIAIVASGLSAFALFQFYPNIYVVGMPQIVLWSPLLPYIYAKEFADGVAGFSEPFIIWLTIASLTMIISILFDIRDVYLVVTKGRGKTQSGEA